VARFILLFILMLAFARFFWRLVETILRGVSGAPAAGARRGGNSPAAVKMQPCPICGTYVVPGKAISAASGGGTVYFCSDKCRAEYQSR
jgi:YHS domain-containing protein